jgi:hypothetical protein
LTVLYMDEVAKIAAPLVAEQAVKLGKKLLKQEEKVVNHPKPKPGRNEPRTNPTRTRTPNASGPIRNPRKGSVSVPSRILVATPKPFFKRKLRAFKGGDSAIIEGCDLAGAYSTNSTAYMEILNFPISPLSLPNTRIAVEAQLWEKYCFEFIELVYIPQQGTGTSGSVMLSSVQDPEQGLPKMGTLAFAQALGAVKGAEITQLFLEAKHLVQPPKTDKKEYYVYPDQDGEDRLTIQGMLKVITMGAFNVSPLCLVYLRYKIRFYERILAPPNLANSGTALTFSVIITGTPVIGSSLKLTDGGITGSMGVSYNTAETNVVLGTVYALMFNFDRGGLEAMQYYFHRPLADLATNVNLRLNAPDANGATGETVSGSWFGGGDLPVNATAWVITAANLPEPGKKKKNPTLALEEVVRQQSKQIDLLADQVTAMNLKMDETTYREVRQVPPLFGGFKNTKGV